jgi:hypothetical protein
LECAKRRAGGQDTQKTNRTTPLQNTPSIIMMNNIHADTARYCYIDKAIRKMRDLLIGNMARPPFGHATKNLAVYGIRVV